MLKQQGRVFSSEVGPGSRKENASKQKAGASVPIQSEWRLWSAMTLHLQGNRTSWNRQVSVAKQEYLANR
jgi:hypothetical protein